MDTTVVTGGAGFIGANLVRALLAKTGERVVVFDALTYAGNRESLASCARDPRFHFVQGDVSDRAAIQALFREYVPRRVIHLAAETHVDRSIDGPRAFLKTNVHGTFEMLEGARGHRDRLDGYAKDAFRFLHVSTDEVHGALGATGRFTEESPFAPNSPYAASKAAAEHLARAWHATFGLQVVVTACCNNYGPFQSPEKFIPLMLLNAIEGRPLPIYGDGQQVRDWIHVEDHVEGLLAALENGRPGERYLLGAEDERTNLQMVEALCEALEEALPAAKNPAMRGKEGAGYADLVTFVKDRPAHDRRYAIDPAKAKRDLRWNAVARFEDGIRSTVRWYLDHRAWCDGVQAKGASRERLGLGTPPDAEGRRVIR